MKTDDHGLPLPGRELDRTFESICDDFSRTRALGAHDLTDEQIKVEAQRILEELKEKERVQKWRESRRLLWSDHRR